jgi:hypothetical protein
MDQLKARVNTLTNNLIGVPSIEDNDGTSSLMSALIEDLISDVNIDPSHEAIVAAIGDEITAMSNNQNEIICERLESQFDFSSEQSRLNVRNYINSVTVSKNYQAISPNTINPHKDSAYEFGELLASDINDGLIQRKPDQLPPIAFVGDELKGETVNPFNAFKFVDERLFSPYMFRNEGYSADGIKQINEPNENISIVLKYQNEENLFLIDTGFNHTNESFRGSTQLKADKSIVSIEWQDTQTYFNLKHAYEVLLNSNPVNPLSVEIIFSYFPQKISTSHKLHHAGSFFRKSIMVRQCTGVPDDVSTGYLVTLIDFIDNVDLIQRYQHGLLLWIKITKSETVPPVSSISHMKIDRIFTKEQRQDILHRLFDYQGGDELIGGLFSKAIKRLRGKKSATPEPIPPPSNELYAQENELVDLSTSSLSSRSGDNTEKQTSSSYSSFRLTDWSERASDRVPIVLVDTNSRSYRDMFAITRRAQVDVSIRDAPDLPHVFIPPTDINYVKLINGALITKKPPKTKKGSLLYDLAGIENANPSAVYEIDFTASTTEEREDIMVHWGWWESSDAETLVIIPRPPFADITWYFEFGNHYKIDAELVINGEPFSLRSSFISPMGKEGDSVNEILRLAPIKNRIVSLVLIQRKLHFIVIQHDKDIIPSESTDVSPIPPSMTASSSSSRTWFPLRSQVSKQKVSEVPKKTVTSIETTPRQMTIYRIGDPSIDSILQNMDRLINNKMSAPKQSPKWIKSLTITDQMPDILPDQPRMTVFSIDLTVTPATKSSPVLRHSRVWTWSQISSGKEGLSDIYIKPDPNYSKPAIFFDTVIDSPHPHPHTWTILAEYGDGSRRLETHVFDIREKDDVVLATIFHGNVHLFVYLQKANYKKSLVFQINAIALINTKGYRALPESILPTHTATAPVSIFAPNHIVKASNEMRVPPEPSEMTLSPPIPFQLHLSDMSIPETGTSGSGSVTPISPTKSEEMMIDNVPSFSPVALQSTEDETSTTTGEESPSSASSTSFSSSTSDSGLKRSQVTTEAVEASIGTVISSTPLDIPDDGINDDELLDEYL